VSADLRGPGPEGLPAVDLGNLYRQETYSDPGFGSVQVLRPVTADGADDPSRPAQYVGSAQIMTARGPVPVQCDLEASSLREAFEKLPEATEKAIQELVARVQELERERAGGIVVPQPGSRLALP